MLNYLKISARVSTCFVESGMGKKLLAGPDQVMGIETRHPSCEKMKKVNQLSCSTILCCLLRFVIIIQSWDSFVIYLSNLYYRTNLFMISLVEMLQKLI